MVRRSDDPRQWHKDEAGDLPLFSGRPAEPQKPMPPAAMSSSTSVEAAESMREAAPLLRERVRKWIASRGEHGATCDEVERHMALRHQTASARVNELMREGRIYEAGRRPTSSGRQATVWRAR